MLNFTEEEVIEFAFKKYGKPISTDYLSDAMKEETIEEAAEVLIIDSVYWDGE